MYTIGGTSITSNLITLNGESHVTCALYSIARAAAAAATAAAPLLLLLLLRFVLLFCALLVAASASSLGSGTPVVA
jgi:hypothetical protein